MKHGVKNVEAYHALDTAALSRLPTRQLMAALQSTRRWILCWCPWGRNGGCDSGLTAEDRAYNEAQLALRVRLKAILAGREHLPRAADRRDRLKRREKKALRYSR